MKMESYLNFIYFYNTPLHIAANKRIKQIIEILLEKGANPNETNNSNISLFILFYETPLYNAVFRSNISITRMLLEKGVNPNDNKDKSKIPLHLACEYGKKQIIELLLKYNADIEARNNNNIQSIF